MESTTQIFHVNTINEVVSDYFGITIEEMKSKSRRTEYVIPRQIAMACAKQVLGLSYQAISRCYGFDHSSVMHSVRVATNEPWRKSQLKLLIELSKDHINLPVLNK